MAKAVTVDQTAKTKLSSRQDIDTDKPTRSNAEDAVRTLIRWAGDDPKRPGMRARLLGLFALMRNGSQATQKTRAIT